MPGVAAGEAFDPTPANLEARTQRFVLPNGMKVALLAEEDARRDSAIPCCGLHYGDEASLKGMSPRGDARRVDALAPARRKRDRQAFEDALDQLRAKLAIGGGETETTAQGETLRAHLPDLLRLAAEALARAGVPARRIREAEARARSLRSTSSAPIRRTSPSARSSAGTIPIRRATSATCRPSTRSRPRFPRRSSTT